MIEKITAAQATQSNWVDPLLRPVPAGTIPSTGIDVTVEASEAERKALAGALKLAGVDSLKATYRLAARSGGIIVVRGEVVAAVRPVCVVTLEPFALAVREPVDLRFADPDRPSRKTSRNTTSEAAEMIGEIDPPDPIENGVIDLGRVTTEFLTLAIPVYPRAPGAAFASDAAEEIRSPFAALKPRNDEGR